MLVFRNTKALTIIGCLLICVSLLLAIVWFGWVLPYFRRFDPNWSQQFTRKAYWFSVEKHIRRFGWTHDDSLEVGVYGDKAWAQWIIAKAEAGQEIANCGNIGHKDNALRCITCNDPARGVQWDSEPQWLSWWATNKKKSQVEWIRAGLQEQGVIVHLPAIPEDYESLLSLLGNSNTNMEEKIPDFVKYNAFRWLRDSGFQSVEFALSNVTVETPKVVRDGLLKYHRLERHYPTLDEIGRLEFASTPNSSHESYRIEFFTPRYQVPAYTAMLAPCLAGVALLIRSRSKALKEDAPDQRGTL